MKIISLILLLLFSAGSSLAETPDWFIKIKRIVPFKTGEKEIETFFGKPVKSYSVVKEYKTREGMLFIHYSSGKCFEKALSAADGYDVERGIVTNADFRVDEKVKFKSLKIDLAGFIKEEANDALGARDYTNRDLEIRYSLSSDLLNYVSLFQPDKFAYLECARKEK